MLLFLTFLISNILLDCEFQETPINIVPPVQFKTLPLSYNFEYINQVRMTKKSPFEYNIENDFGVIEIDQKYSLKKIRLLGGSSFQISDINFPFQISIQGESLGGNLIEILIFFEKSQKDNDLLFQMKFGQNQLNQLQSESFITIQNFSINQIFRENPENLFLYFTGTAQEVCQETLFLVFYLTLPISENQLNDIEIINNYKQNPLRDNFTIYKNKNDNSDYIDLVKQKWIPQNYVNFLVIDNHIPIPEFIYKESQEQDQTIQINSNQDETNLVTFEIYSPIEGMPWGYVPQNAVFPWEKESVFLEQKSIIIKEMDQIYSPLENYKYIPFFYYKNRGGIEEEGKLIYVPYLILVQQDTPALDFPVNNLNIFSPILNKVVNVKINRGDIDESVKKQNQKGLEIVAIEETQEFPTDIIDHKQQAQSDTEDDPIQQQTILKENSLNSDQTNNYQTANFKTPISLKILKSNIDNKVYLSYPKIKKDLHLLPSNCIHTNDDLPQNSGILDLLHPLPIDGVQVEKTHYQILYFCPVGDYSIKYEQLFIPFWFLVHEKFLIYNSKKEEKIPFVIFENEKFKIKYELLQEITKPIEEIIEDKNFLFNMDRFGLDIYDSKDYMNHQGFIQEQKQEDMTNEIQEIKKQIMENTKTKDLSQIPINFDSTLVDYLLTKIN